MNDDAGESKYLNAKANESLYVNHDADEFKSLNANANKSLYVTWTNIKYGTLI